MNKVSKRSRSEKGATMIEYCLFLSLLAMASLPSLWYMQASIRVSSFSQPMLLLVLGGGSKGS